MSRSEAMRNSAQADDEYQDWDPGLHNEENAGQYYDGEEVPDVLEDEDEVEDEDEENEGYAQFVDSDELDSEEDAPTSEEENEESVIRQELDAVPFNKLVKAQRQLRRSNESAKDEPLFADIKEKRELAKQRLREMGFQSKPKTTQASAAHQLEVRENKNAPTVMSSRRPVSRLRNVVEPIQRGKVRDPRFDSLSAGPVNLDLHAKSYSFLPGVYADEIKSLRETHSKLKRMESHHAGPRAKSEQALNIRSERAKVELALRRAESQHNERIRRERERSVKADIKRENQRRVDSGLRPYFPKKNEFKEAVLRKQFEGLGHSSALRKTMDRKRRKDAQKERKSLDAALGGGARTDISHNLSARRVSSEGHRPHKRGRRG